MYTNNKDYNKKTKTQYQAKHSNPAERSGFDGIKRTMRRMESVFEVLLLTLVYYGTWTAFYRDFWTMPTYLGRGKLVLMGVYAMLILILFYMSDSFKFGHLRKWDVIVSQWIGVFLVNGITYLQLALAARRRIAIYPMLLLVAIDCALVTVMVTMFTALYHRHYIPRDMIMIYGKEDAVDLKFKMDTRADKYEVTAVIRADTEPEVLKEEIAKHNAVILNDIPAEQRNDILKYCYERGIRVYLVPKLSDIIIRGAEEVNLFDTPLQLVKGGGLTPAQNICKRAMDLLLCTIAMIPCAPIMLIIALAIKLEDHGPVFYRQKRVTLNGAVFEILKFRSMIVDAEKGGYNLTMRANGKDPRITKVGSFIRACRLDELPQLINILKGDMSIVGPRPERVENVAEYTAMIPEFTYRTKVKGGLTGYAQIYGKYNTSPYDKLRLDLMYIEHYSILLDIKLIFMTLQILVRPESTEGFEKVEELEKKKNELLHPEVRDEQ